MRGPAGCVITATTSRTRRPCASSIPSGWSRCFSRGPRASERTASGSLGSAAPSSGWPASCCSSAPAASSGMTSRPSSTRRRTIAGSQGCSSRSWHRSTGATRPEPLRPTSTIFDGWRSSWSMRTQRPAPARRSRSRTACESQAPSPAVPRGLGVRRAAGWVVTYQMLHTLGMLLSFLTAIVLGALLLPPHAALLAGLAVAFTVLAALCWLLLTGHRRGVLEQALNLMHRIPLLDRLARRLEPTRATLAQMDEQITEFYHKRPRRFYQALVLEYLSRSIFMLEYVLIGLSVGFKITYLQAYAIGGPPPLAPKRVFLRALRTGIHKGSLYAVFRLPRLGPSPTVCIAVVSRR